MSEISAADNHSILTKPGKWRLAYNDRPLAEGSDKGFRYSGSFGQTRRLPETGVIQQNDIQQVVLGWQATDESWHLGLILAPPLAQQRGSRWCEIVHWPDPEITVFQDLAQTSGQELAQSIGVPFYVIPPQAVKAAAPPRELPKLPLHFGDWQMKALAPNQYLIERTSSWAMRRVSKVLWYIFWSIMYAVLSFATLFGSIALPKTGTLLPNPQILPYMGLGISLVLLLAAIYQTGMIFFTFNRIKIDGAERVISAWRGKNMYWTVQQSEIQSLYVSELVKKNEQAPATEYGEMNLHLGGGKFRFIAGQEQPSDNSKTPQPDLIFPRTDGIRELERDVVHTDLQAAGMYIGEAMGHVTVWYDLRVK